MFLDKLNKLEKESISRGIPILGKEKGSWLYSKVKEIKPKRILELGTANGYSGIILGSFGAELVTLELNEKIGLEAKNNFNEFNIKAKIIIGDGIEEIKIFKNGEFDLVFIDFAKKKYFEILEEVIRITKKRGYIIADNISFEEVKKFKESILKDKRLKTEIISIKDGLSFSKKL